MLTPASEFLEQVEYYPSLLFLTTNRKHVLDPAVYSRIHLTINYPALDVDARRTIWRTFLDRENAKAKMETTNGGRRRRAGRITSSRSGDSTNGSKLGSIVTDEEIDRLASLDLNGRRIRNVVKSARIMAKREARPIEYDDFRKVMRITEGIMME